jgi:hypothetical protein
MTSALSEELFLPDPAPRPIRYTVISVDDHVVEPPHMFDGRVPAALADRAPRIVETSRGYQVWEFEGRKYSQIGMNAVAGRRPETVSMEPFRFDQMRPGCYDVDARVGDMDLGGVWASLNFPSQISGFCGRVFFDAADQDLGLACLRAWNDWLYEEWYAAHPTRIIPLGITYLSDPALAVEEIKRNADRGFTSVRHCPNGRMRSACHRCGTASTGTRSSPPASRPTPSSHSTSEAPGCRHCRPAPPPYSCPQHCSDSSHSGPALSGFGRSIRCATQSSRSR